MKKSSTGIVRMWLAVVLMMLVVCPMKWYSLAPEIVISFSAGLVGLLFMAGLVAYANLLESGETVAPKSRSLV